MTGSNRNHMNIITLALGLPGLAPSLCALLAVLAFASQARAEEPYVQWANSAGGGGNPGVMAVSPTGNVLVLRGFPRYLLRFNPQGQLVSSNAVASLTGGLSSPTRVWVDASDAVFLTGLKPLEGGDAFSVVKLSAAGELIWACRESEGHTNSPNLAVALAPDPSGNLWVAGVSSGPITLGTFVFGEGSGPVLCKLAPDGQVLLAKRIEHTRTSQNALVAVHDLCVDSAGAVLVSGYLCGGSTDFGGTTVHPGATQANNWGDGFIAKYDAAGALLWVRLAEVQGTVGMSIALDRVGNIYFLESSTRFGKLSPEGALIWTKEFAGSFLGMFQSILVDADDEPVFTGEILGTVRFGSIVLRSQSTIFQDLFVAKSDKDGNIRWAMRGGGGTRGARGWTLVADASNNFFLGAEIYGNSSKLDGLSVTGLTLAKISERPRLTLATSTQGLRLSWPAKATNHVRILTPLRPAATARRRWIPPLPPHASSACGSREASGPIAPRISIACSSE
jgi:hypothetical protein